VAIGREVGWPVKAETESRHSRSPKIVVVNVNKNAEIFMTFGMASI
jgi:hypothetical protein